MVFYFGLRVIAKKNSQVHVPLQSECLGKIQKERIMNECKIQFPENCEVFYVHSIEGRIIHV